MESVAPGNGPNRASAAAASAQQALGAMTNRRRTIGEDNVRTPPPTSARLAASLHEHPYDLQQYLDQPESKRGTVLYLAHGSNLSNETFRGNRGIKPLSQVNVQVPELRLTFDLPGIPYAEPCFANTGRRDPKHDPFDQTDINNEKTPLLGQKHKKDKYLKDRWHKGLIGVVYEVTREDYAHIIQTEGGGSSYHDILVDCHPFTTGDPNAPVPQDPILPPFKAHTLFAPATAPDEAPPVNGGRFQRPDTSYAQPSARYLKLMTDGAAELGLPYEYQDYLHAIRPYTMSSGKQRLGQYILLALWVPIVFMIFGMGRMFADDKGRLPGWLRELTGAIFKAVWASYDTFFKPMFGDGERTIADGGDDSSGLAKMKHERTVEAAGVNKPSFTDQEKASSAEQLV